ncbi:hydroxyisourate hydrolase [Massilia litorea]|uniref:5-hydroxyisourate hydrolase n=1 Tax=Massilia litorea TaxID=2769491 RepID=A0A7L9U864_9BURK|nr:hydroxyisourate hydrolase [Massilia litorea]QOL51188.1 hydroxyisourate hydrolase [Massilia litorea]
MHTTIRRSFLAAALLSSCLHALAADNPLSVHILDLQSGQPTPGVAVTLEQQDKGEWRALGSAVTDAQGRVRALYPAGKALASGAYRIVFKTGEHYARLRQPTFFEQIPIEFKVADTTQHYHIPLLLSPYGYSTYRGN